MKSRHAKLYTLAAGLLLILGVAIAVFPAPAQVDGYSPSPVMPAYNDEGELLLPEGYERWIFVGSSLGLSYSQGASGTEMFHHTLMEPTAHAHFAETGEFREGTMLALLLHGQGENVMPARQGRFANEVQAVEMAVKDSSRHEEGWAYYNFGARNGIRKTSTAFAKNNCYSCHVEHAERDNVFLQFYPLLKQAAPAAMLASLSEADEAAGPMAGDENDMETEEEASEGRVALRGLDPVMLVEGQEELGKPEIIANHEGFVYQFVSEPTRARFADDPERYSIQNETCPVIPGASISGDLFSVHQGRIYAFASQNCVSDFEVDPQAYVAVAEPEDQTSASDS